MTGGEGLILLFFALSCSISATLAHTVSVAFVAGDTVRCHPSKVSVVGVWHSRDFRTNLESVCLFPHAILPIPSPCSMSCVFSGSFVVPHKSGPMNLWSLHSREEQRTDANGISL